MEWIRTANSKASNNIRKEFQETGYIDWRQGKNKYEIGDIIFIYIISPIKKIEFKTKVEKIDIPFDATDKEESIAGDGKVDEKYVRLRFIKYIDDKRLNLKNLKENGFRSSLQGPSKIKDEQVSNYINDIFDDFNFNRCTEIDV